MKRHFAIAAVIACLPLAACGGSPSNPTPPGTQGAVSIPAYLIGPTPAGTSTPCPAIGFEDAGAPAAAFGTYTRCGFTVAATSGSWMVWTGYGHPAPFIGFMSAHGVTSTAAIRVTSAAGKFTFQSVDVYASTTPIPYRISGLVNSATVFTIQGTQPNTFGNFATVSNPNPNAQVDTLVIELTNSAAPCCDNPMGFDNIVVK